MVIGAHCLLEAGSRHTHASSHELNLHLAHQIGAIEWRRPCAHQLYVHLFAFPELSDDLWAEKPKHFYPKIFFIFTKIIAKTYEEIKKWNFTLEKRLVLGAKRVISWYTFQLLPAITVALKGTNGIGFANRFAKPFTLEI